jgi:hypothetical protein
VTATGEPGGGRPGRLIVIGAIVTAVGLAIAATAPVVGTAPATRVQPQQETGGVVVLLGWALLAWGIHRFGRGDPADEPDEPDDGPPGRSPPS